MYYSAEGEMERIENTCSEIHHGIVTIADPQASCPLITEAVSNVANATREGVIGFKSANRCRRDG
jgi:hypothetical protein